MFFSSFYKKSISIEKEYCQEGISLNVFLNIRNKKIFRITFPLDENITLSKYLKKLTIEYQQKLIVLQQLWSEEILQPYQDNSFIIPYSDLYKIDNEDRLTVSLPKDIKNLKIKIYTNGIITSPDFKILYDLFLPTGKKLDKYYIIDNLLFFDNQYYLLEQQLYELISIIKSLPEEKSIDDVAKIISLLQSKSNNKNIILEDYLKNEEYLFVDEIDYKIEKIDEDEITIEPVILNNYEKSDEINEILISNHEYLEKIKTIPFGHRRIRLFSNNEVTHKYNTIKRLPKFKGSQIPKLLENPNSLLPDWIDLDEFSKRVKEIGIKVYHLKPNIKLKEDAKTGLFELIPGIKLESFDNLYSEELSIDNILPILRESNDEYIKIGDKWVKNNYDDIERFKYKADEIENKYKSEDSKITKNDVKFVLEIFENIVQLEYSETVIDFKIQISKEEIEFIRPKLIEDDIEIKDFQKEGINWLKTLHKNSLGGILADEMGLGKTFQIIVLLAYLKEIEKLKPSFVVAPYTLIDNWINEIDKFAPSLKENLYIHHDSNRLKNVDELSNKDIVMTTYDTLVRDQIILAKVNWKAVICDEAQYIKNPDAYRTKAVKALKAKTRIALTGTPLENGLSEFWCIMDFVQPGLLDCYSKFKERFEGPIVSSESYISQKVNQELLKIIKPHYLRRTKEDNLQGLPKKHSKPYYVEMTDYQKLLYKEVISKFKNSGNKKQILLDTLNQLIYVCDYPDLLHSNVDSKDYKKLINECAKFKKLCEILDDIKQKNEKALIFTRFKAVQTILASIIQQRYGICTNILNGEIQDSSRRFQIIDKFNKSIGFNVLILNTQVGGVGLNITSANHVIHYTREWNPAKEDQATDRVYRIGQQKDVYVYNIITTAPDLVKKTIDEHIHDLLQAKKDLFREVVVPNKFELTADELEEILLN